MWLVVAIVLAVILVVVLITKSGGGTTTWDTASSTEELADTASTSPATSGSVTTKSVTTVTKPVTSTAPKMTASGAYIVYYTSAGFSPASLSLIRGSASVHFVNNAGAALRIAPIDTKNKPYAEFSQSKSVGYGGTFDYTFTTAGSYGYYNENNKAHRAIINVQ